VIATETAVILYTNTIEFLCMRDGKMGNFSTEHVVILTVLKVFLYKVIPHVDRTCFELNIAILNADTYCTAYMFGLHTLQP